MALRAVSLSDDIPLDDYCAAAVPQPGDRALTTALSTRFPKVERALSRGGWHRSGGVVTAEGGRIAENLRDWAEEESDGDVLDLIAKYGDDGLRATRFAGRSIYYVVPVGDDPLDFIQIEIEETQEVQDRELLPDGWMPDDVEELLAPVDGVSVAPEPVGKARYALRRVTDFQEIGTSITEGDSFFQRFLADWERSSAGAETRFCDHFVLVLVPYADRFGAHRFDVRPQPRVVPEEPTLAEDDVPRGTALGRFLMDFDRAAGHPMAWFFQMVGARGLSYKVAEAVSADLHGAFAYLPRKDVAVVHDWVRNPYSM